MARRARTTAAMDDATTAAVNAYVDAQLGRPGLPLITRSIVAAAKGIAGVLAAADGPVSIAPLDSSGGGLGGGVDVYEAAAAAVDSSDGLSVEMLRLTALGLLDRLGLAVPVDGNPAERAFGSVTAAALLALGWGA